MYVYMTNIHPTSADTDWFDPPDQISYLSVTTVSYEHAVQLARKPDAYK